MTNDAYRILVADDEDVIRNLLVDLLSDAYYVETVIRGDIIPERLRAAHFDILVLDLHLPGMSGMDVLQYIHDEQIPVAVIVLTASSDVETAIRAMKLGAYDYVTKPFDNERFSVIVKNITEKIELQHELYALRREVGESHRFQSIIGSSADMQRVFSTVEKVMDTENTILITGESGTGKGVLAKAIHYNSNRKNEPFRAVDCSSLPEELIGSELFGHEKGSFTGAISRKTGKFEAAEKGTLFLDEISNISIEIQAKLLRVIQEREFERIGGNQIIKMSARIIAASNRDIRQLVRDGKFREDLYYRLNVVPVYLPPLRERMDDIPLFIDHFIRKFSAEYSREVSIDMEGMLFLSKYLWPGNVRQLENLIRRMILLSTSQKISVHELQSLIRFEESERGNVDPVHHAAVNFSSSSFYDEAGRLKTFDRIEKEAVEEALGASGYNITEAAKLLGVSRKTMHNKINVYGLQIDRILSKK